MKESVKVQLHFRTKNTILTIIQWPTKLNLSHDKRNAHVLGIAQ
ncbi:hypothetical protein QWZ13_16120 [Reinekea marina]|nr:hypothetical protein [Reinekea marina]MDN3650435.1 hypothetical protein [Reinekea marina]